LKRVLPLLTLSASLSAAVVGGTWSSLGPAPVQQLAPAGAASGRVSALALDLGNDPTGNHLYVGAAQGGLWKSSNAQAATPSFTALTDSLPNLAVGCIALDSSVNPPVIYLGSGEPNLSADSYYGVGVFKSTDDGATWSQVSSADGGAHPFRGLAFSDIQVDPADHNILVAVAGRTDMAYWMASPPERGIFRSTDAGATWSLVYNSGHGATSLVYDSTRSAYFAAVSSDGLYKSTDQGVSWTPLHSPFPSGSTTTTAAFDRPILATRGGKLYCVVAGPTSLSAPNSSTDSGLSQSADGGVTWTKIRVSPLGSSTLGRIDASQADYDVVLGVPPGTNTMVLSLIDVFTTVSPTTASTWTDRTNAYNGGTVHPDEHAFAALDATHWFIGNDGGVWRTADAGVTWTDLNTDLDTIQFTSVSADPFNAGLYLGASQDNGTERGPTSGSSWDQTFDGDGGYTAMDPTQSGVCYTERDGIDLWRSSDGGLNFNKPVVDGTVISDAALFYPPYALVPGQPQTMLYGAQRIWRGPSNPSSLGAGWQAISQDLGDPVAWLDICAADNSKAWAVTMGSNGTSKVLRGSGILGASPVWTDVTKPNLPNAYGFSWIAADPQDPQRAILSVLSFGTGHLWLTQDGGGSWTDISGDLPDLPVNGVRFDPAYPSYVYAATDAGVYVITDGGAAGAAEAWSQMGSGLPNSMVSQLQLSPGLPRMLVAATHGRGAWTLAALVAPTPTVSPTVTPTATQSPVLSPTPTSSSSASFTRTPTASPSGTRTASPTRSASPTPSASPSLTATPSSGPSVTASPSASASPTAGAAAFAQAPMGLTAAFYPQPLRRGQTLQLALGTSPQGPVTLRLYDLAGERVAQAELAPGAGIDSSGLAPGIYFGVVEVGGQRLRLKLAVVAP
jgi:photosystem II stability/assembly factor-like uncharacterized protein